MRRVFWIDGGSSAFPTKVKSLASEVMFLLAPFVFGLACFLVKRASLMKMSSESTWRPGALPRLRPLRICEISLLVKWSRLREVLDRVRLPTEVGTCREGGWSLWRVDTLSVVMVAMGVVLVSLAFADLKLSQLAASWAELRIATGCSLNSFADLLMMVLLSW